MSNYFGRLIRTRGAKNVGFLVAMYSTAELTQQTMLGQHDAAKIGRVGTTCLLVNGPANHFWYKLLDGVLKGTSSRIVLAKTALDIFVFTPISICGFVTGMSILERKADIFAEARQKTSSTYAVGVGFWTLAQAINFYFVPPQYRIIYVGTAGFVWTNFVCHIKHQLQQLMPYDGSNAQSPSDVTVNQITESDTTTTQANSSEVANPTATDTKN